MTVILRLVHQKVSNLISEFGSIRGESTAPQIYQSVSEPMVLACHSDDRAHKKSNLRNVRPNPADSPTGLASSYNLIPRHVAGTNRLGCRNGRPHSTHWKQLSGTSNRGASDARALRFLQPD